LHVERPAEEDQEVQLGRNPSAAFIATDHGIGLDDARKKYAGQPVGQYCSALARMVTTFHWFVDLGHDEMPFIERLASFKERS